MHWVNLSPFLEEAQDPGSLARAGSMACPAGLGVNGLCVQLAIKIICCLVVSNEKRKNIPEQNAASCLHIGEFNLKLIFCRKKNPNMFNQPEILQQSL